ncbi:MAG TPA: hypothetical protein DEB33_08235 [Gemmatimonadetes bacterium]|nr:hypothetical protein [Gemmatimonadota bacterium]
MSTAAAASSAKWFTRYDRDGEEDVARQAREWLMYTEMISGTASSAQPGLIGACWWRSVNLFIPRC